MRTALFIFLVSFFSINSTFSQSKIRVLNADINSYNPSKNEARLLWGNVKIEHKGILLFCDTMHFYDKRNFAKAYGHVQINQADTLNVYGDTIFYDGSTREATVFGNVKLVDDNAILRSPTLVFRLDSNIAYYDKGGFMYDSETGDTLISDVGTYYGNRKQIDFKGNVYYSSIDYKIESDKMMYNSAESKLYFDGPTTITTRADSSTIYCEKGWYNTQTNVSSFSGNGRIESDGQVIEGDSIVYNRSNGAGEIFGNMSVIDTVSNFIVLGDYGKIDKEKGEYLITGDPVFQQINENDTLFLKADTLFAIVDTINQSNVIQAYHHVRFIQAELVGKCDSLFYNEKDSLLEMYHSPVLWQDSSQLYGDTILLDVFDGVIDKMRINNKAFILSLADSTGLNQVYGRNMVGRFEDNALQTINVLGNGKSIYYAKSKDGDYIGMDHSVCSDIRIIMEDDEISEIVFIKKPESTLYPIDQIPVDIKLFKGSVWDKKRANEIKLEFDLLR